MPLMSMDVHDVLNEKVVSRARDGWEFVDGT